MTPEVARILRTFSAQERAMYLAIGGTIPPFAPTPLYEWRAVDTFRWTAKDAKRIKRRKVAA